MSKSKYGFTMVELLVTIVILGLLFTLGYFSVTAILNRANDSYYASQEDMIVLAGRDYFADYRSELPKEIGETNFVTLKTLIDEGYIDPVKDRNDNDCNYEGSIVIAQKITNDEYQYYVTLLCDNDNYETTEDDANPVIKFSPNRKSSTEAITVKMEVTDNKGVASYRYVIVKEGETYYDSDYQLYNGEVTINLTEKGLYTIIGYAIDTSGNRGDGESGKYSIYEGIDCANVEFSGSTKEQTWTNKDIGVDITVPSNTYRFEVSIRKNGGEYTVVDNYLGSVKPSLTINEEGKTQIKVTAYDAEGNSCVAVSKEYYIDKTKPSCNIEFKGTIGDNGWYKEKNVTVSLNGSDNLNLAKSGLTTSSSVTYNGTTSASQGNTSGTTWYGYVLDGAGNANSCSATLKVDTTAPSCSVYVSGTKGNNGWYKDKNANLSLSHLDILSGVASYGLTTSTSAIYNGSTSGSQGNTGGTIWYGYVKDKAGNVASCSNTVKVDTVKPTCSIAINGTIGDNGWYKEKNSTLLLNRADNLSGIAKSGLTTSTGTTYNSTLTATQGNTSGTTWRGYVMDNAGNTNSCSTSLKVDTTAPSCSVYVSGTKGNNGWYKDKNANLSLSHLDILSGIASYGLTTSTTTTYNGSVSASQGNTGGTTWRGYVKDKAGNVASCSNTVKVDTVKPTINSVTLRQDTSGKVIDPDYKDHYFQGSTFTNKNFNYYLLTSAGGSRRYYANASASDSLSSVGTVQVCNSDGSSCVNNNTGVLTSSITSSKANKKIRVTDKAGNVSEFPFTLTFYTSCQEWFLLNYANALGRYPELSGVNVHVKQYFNYINGGTSGINNILISNGITARSKEYAMISIYWDIFTVTEEARVHCGSSPTQATNECLVRHWYYTLLRRQPENNTVITQRVNDIGSTEWTKFYYDRGNYGGIAAFEPYTKMLTNFIAVANAENVLKNLNTSNWNSNTCYFKGEEGFN